MSSAVRHNKVANLRVPAVNKVENQCELASLLPACRNDHLVVLRANCTLGELLQNSFPRSGSPNDRMTCGLNRRPRNRPLFYRPGDPRHP